MNLQASLRQRCPDLQQVPDSTGKTLLRWALVTVREYRVCQDRAARAAEAVQTPALTEGEGAATQHP